MDETFHNLFNVELSFSKVLFQLSSKETKVVTIRSQLA